MTPIAPHIAAFLRERLPLQRGASEHTCDSYAYAFPALWRIRHQTSFSAGDINALPAAAIDCGRSRHKLLNSLHNLLVWWRLRHNAVK
jgi:hypothetical protein